MIPTHHLYLADLCTGRVEAIFPTDHLRTFAELCAYELALRAAHGLDRTDPSLALRSSYTAPLPRERLEVLTGSRRARRTLRMLRGRPRQRKVLERV